MCRLRLICMSAANAGYRRLGSCSQLPRDTVTVRWTAPGLDNFIDLALLTAVFSAKLAAPTQKLRCSSASTRIFCFPALIRTAENEVGEISFSYIIVLNLRLIL